MPQRLKHRPGHDTKSGKHKAGTDNTKGWNTNRQHLFRSIEYSQKPRRKQLCHTEAYQHNDRCRCRSQLHGLKNAVRLLCPIIVGNNWHHAIVQPKHRHENERLQFIINTKYCGGRIRKGNQYFVQAKHHH